MKPSDLLLGLTAAALVLAIVLLAPQSSADTSAPSIGSPAPDFKASDENGVVHQLADYRGKLLVLEWTNPDCPFVARHYKADTMEKLAKKLGASSVEWVAVNSTHYNKPADTLAWRKDQGFDYVTLQDTDGAIGRRFGARSTPHMFVVGPDGTLRYSGAIDDDARGQKAEPTNYVDSAVAKLVEGGSPDPSETVPYGCSVKYGPN